jgi:hypothetical protein
MPGIATGACFAIESVCSTPDSCRSAYDNHMICLTELRDWAAYYVRAFSHTNRLSKHVRLSKRVRKE